MNLNFDTVKTREDAVKILSDRFGLRKAMLSTATVRPPAPSPAPSDVGNPDSNKRKNKKKKKGKGQQAAAEDTAVSDTPVKVSENLAEVNEIESTVNDNSSTADSSRIEQEIIGLRMELSTKADAVERLSEKLKDQEVWKEEIETLRDDLLHQGQEHVEARDALKEAQMQKNILQEGADKLERELLEARAAIVDGANKDKAYQEILVRFDESKQKYSTLEENLRASEQLAAGRFKDITDLKELLAKAQPELRILRNEIAELKIARG